MSERVDCVYFQSLPVSDKQLDKHYDEVVKCRKLWRAVIDLMVEDVLNEPRNKDEVEWKRHAEFWLSGGVMYDAKTEGFADVCDLAGFAPDWVQDRIKYFVEHGTTDTPVSI